MKLFIHTFFLLFSLTTYSQNSFQVQLTLPISLVETPEQFTFLIEYIEDGNKIQSENFTRDVYSKEVLIEVGGNLENEFWRTNNPTQIKIYYVNENGNNLLYNLDLNSVPLSLSTLNIYSDEKNINPQNNIVNNVNSNSIYSVLEDGNYSINIKSSSDFFVPSSWRTANGNLEIVRSNHRLNVGDKIIIKSSVFKKYLEVLSVNESSFQVENFDFGDLNFFYYSPAYGVTVLNDRGNNSNITGDIEYIILSAPQNHKLNLKSISVYSNDQTENIILGIEDYNYLSTPYNSNLIRVPVITSYSNWYGYNYASLQYGKSSSQINGWFYDGVNPDSFLSQFNFNNDGVVLRVIGVDAFEENIFKITF